jgi:hypothetical protein
MNQEPPVQRLETVLGAIKAELPQDIFFSVGQEKELARMQSPPRIVMEPLRFAITSSRGGKEALYTRLETVRVHVWGRSMADAEDLTEVLLNAARKVVAAAMEPGEGEWEMGGVTDRGVEVLFDLVFWIPVIRRASRARFLPLDPMTMDVVPPEAAS